MARRDVVSFLKQQVADNVGGFFEAAPEGGGVAFASAPGRLDVLGGLGVHVGGTVAQMAIPRRVGVAVQRIRRPVLKICSDQFTPPLGESCVEVALPESGMPVMAQGWAAPLVALWLRHKAMEPRGGRRGGCIRVASDVPLHAGQASSTALLTALALALSDNRGDPAALAGLVKEAEAACGHADASVVDAMSCLLAERPCVTDGLVQRGGVMRYSTQPGELVGHVPLPENLRILALDTGVRHHSAAAVMDELRVAGAMGLKLIETIYRDLGQSHTPLHGYLANTSPLLYRQYFRALLPRRMRGSDFVRTYGPLPESAGLNPAGVYRVRTAVDHFIAENEHAEQFLQAIEELSERGPEGRPAMLDPEERQRTLQRAGRLALASHHSYRLRLEMSCREADWLVDRLMAAGPERGIYGARITSAGGGGTVMALVDGSSSAGDAVLEAADAYSRVTGLSLSIAEAGVAGSEGALLTSASDYDR